MKKNRFYSRLALAGALFFITLVLLISGLWLGSGGNSASAMGFQQVGTPSGTPVGLTPWAYLPLIYQKFSFPTGTVTPTGMVTVTVTTTVTPTTTGTP